MPRGRSSSGSSWFAPAAALREISVVRLFRASSFAPVVDSPGRL